MPERQWVRVEPPPARRSLRHRLARWRFKTRYRVSREFTRLEAFLLRRDCQRIDRWRRARLRMRVWTFGKPRDWR
jgi:hypothetical protein